MTLKTAAVRKLLLAFGSLLMNATADALVVIIVSVVGAVVIVVVVVAKMVVEVMKKYFTELVVLEALCEDWLFTIARICPAQQS